MEEKIDALVIRAIDQKDNDKLLTLLTAGKGKILATCKGVRKATAKLKFAAQPFCFAEYVLAERNGRYTVTSAYQHDGFYALREDVMKYYAAAAVLEACDRLAPEGLPADELLVSAVRALGEICEGEERGALLKFLLGALSFGGYGIDLEGCVSCGGEIGKTPYFHFAHGGFCCAGCPTETRASLITYQAMRKAAGREGAVEELQDGEKRALRLIKEYFCQKTESKADCLAEYIRLI